MKPHRSPGVLDDVIPTSMSASETEHHGASFEAFYNMTRARAELAGPNAVGQANALTFPADLWFDSCQGAVGSLSAPEDTEILAW